MPQRTLPDLPWISRSEFSASDEAPSEVALTPDELRELSRRMQMIREDERKVIARELHDELGQQLTALRLGLMHLQLDATSQQPELKPAFEHLTRQLGATIAMSRDMVTKLRPAALDMGLETALEWLVEQFQRTTRISCRLIQHCHQLELDDYTAIALFRIAQEALNNIAKHAHATDVRIVLHRTEDPMLLMCIRDNGIGFEVQQKTQSSYGLIGIRERVSTLNGQLYLFSARGQGTHLEVQLPLENS
ncbi:sensor histidine kinase [Pokkaliibacter sp. CJK22405]|uniref:sensor histidine kinase n=1 Tax=Pokkaliibacter sp. CJK22405 TaxID=3384615 RepID=UPI0039855019